MLIKNQKRIREFNENMRTTSRLYAKGMMFNIVALIMKWLFSINMILKLILSLESFYMFEIVNGQKYCPNLGLNVQHVSFPLNKNL